MADREFDLASNIACTNNRGEYYARVFFCGPGGSLFRPFTINLGPSAPEVANPSDDFDWMQLWLDRQRTVSIKRESIIAASITRLCFSAGHRQLPKSRAAPYIGTRLELVRNYIVAQEGAQPFRIEKVKADDIHEDGIGILRRKYGDTIRAVHAVFPPVYATRQEPRPVTAGIEVACNGRRALTAALREPAQPEETLQEIVRPSQIRAAE